MPYAPDPRDLVAEYLYEPVLVPSFQVLNSADAPGSTGIGTIVSGIDYPLMPPAATDVPPGFPTATSLHFNVIPRLIDELGVDTCNPGDSVNSGMSQYVEVSPFPALTSLTAEVWVKTTYIDKGEPHPDRKFGFGGCPQPLCRSCSWYLFISTAMTARNLTFTHVPNEVVTGMPKFDEDANVVDSVRCGPDPACPPGNVAQCPGEGTVQSGHGGVLSTDEVPAEEWAHLAATFGPDPDNPGRFIAETYINGVLNTARRVVDACGNEVNFPVNTNNPLDDRAGAPLRIGIFRQAVDTLDYQFSGLIAGVRVYGRALNRAEIMNDIVADTRRMNVSARRELGSGTLSLRRDVFPDPEATSLRYLFFRRNNPNRVSPSSR